MPGQLHPRQQIAPSTQTSLPDDSLPAYSLTELTDRSPAAAIAGARELLLEYGQFVAAQPNVATFCYGALKEEAACLPHSYLNQNGGAILAIVRDFPVGFVAWRSLPNPALASAWELKRLWIRPEARGLKIGRALVQSVVDRARAAAKTAIYLDTAPHAMAPALRLYRQMGFVECPSYNGPPSTGILYLCRAL